MTILQEVQAAYARARYTWPENQLYVQVCIPEPLVVTSYNGALPKPTSFHTEILERSFWRNGDGAVFQALKWNNQLVALGPQVYP